MAETVVPLNGTETTYNINLDGLPSGSAGSGDAVDLTAAISGGGLTGAPCDVEVAFQVQTAAGTLATNANVTFYFAPLGVSTNYTDGVSSTAQNTWTPPSSQNSITLAVVNVSAANTATHCGGKFLSVLAGGGAFTKGVIWAQNNTGLALLGTAGQKVNNSVSFRPKQWQATP